MLSQRDIEYLKKGKGALVLSSPSLLKHFWTSYSLCNPIIKMWANAQGTKKDGGYIRVVKFTSLYTRRQTVVLEKVFRADLLGRELGLREFRTSTYW